MLSSFIEEEEEEKILKRLTKIDVDLITEEEAKEKHEAWHDYHHFCARRAMRKGKPFVFATCAKRKGQTYIDCYKKAVANGRFKEFWDKSVMK